MRKAGVPEVSSSKGLIPLLDRIVLVRRRSPDWRGLACDYEAGIPIDPRRYRPTDVPGLPQDLPRCIRLWNDISPVNFFRCRQTLKEISERTLAQVSGAVVISEDQLPELPAVAGTARFMLFFFDDDDLFAPDMINRLSPVELGECDVAVFPLVRLGDYSYTFVRGDRAARVVVGRRQEFRYRYQTNNYGISARIALSRHLPHLKEHAAGSLYADEQQLIDAYFDTVLSATNKTPCSLAMIRTLPANPGEYHDYLRRYVLNLRQLDLPPDMDWLNGPVKETTALFGAVAETV
jgi:hypothetical protein